MSQQLDFHHLFETAQQRLERRLKAGEVEENNLLDIVSRTVIFDRLVAPMSASFRTEQKVLRLHYADGKVVNIHPHAFGQVCAKVGVPMTYAHALRDSEEAWRPELLAYNLNELFRKSTWTERGGIPSRFLHRIVGDELRGFLSRRYNRHLASAPLLRSFIDACRLEGARPIEATSSPIRSALKCILPKVFEIFPGEYISIGVEWSNSDFGAGKLKVLQTIWRQNSASSVVFDEGLAKAHIGSVIQDSDIEMSDETAQKEVAAQQSAVRDHVKEYLSETMVDRLIKGIRAARDEQIPWSALRSRLRDVLRKSEMDWLESVLDQKSQLIDLPPVSFSLDGAPIPNRYWAATAVSTIAMKTEDPDHKLTLQKEAGKLLAAALGK